jgi:hypothetical protein
MENMKYAGDRVANFFVSVAKDFRFIFHVPNVGGNRSAEGNLTV